MSNCYVYNGTIYTEDELKHYGVVGMKWGHRKAQERGETYTYTSYGTKRYKRIADRARARGNIAKQKKYEQYHKRSVELDRKMQKNALSNSNGKAVVKTLVNGFLGGRTYEAVKAATGGSGRTSRVIATISGQLTGPFGATAARALYVRGVNMSSVVKEGDKIVDDLLGK